MELPSTAPPNFYDFLNRIRHPTAADLIRSIKSFIVSFSFENSDAEDEGQRIQDFLARMETTVKEHPLWAHAARQEIDNAMEFAAKELQKINAFKAPRDKLHCIMNCCRIINNLLLEISMTTNHKLAGADDFLPILIFTTIKANPPHLHSNLKFIQLFRKHSKLVSEVEYYLTNLISAKTFIANINASSLSMDESEFNKNMQLVISANEMTINEPSAIVHSSEGKSSTLRSHGKEINAKDYRYPFMEAKAQDPRFEDV
ncbi:vacuolar protein sorting-associated protein 9A-like [Zingiber officinale]|uniref:vacuolar protein sorting-associated protein 9A-like n=1 Tax=Zingiber officinale TaxID=94328 RepID=UPI001C4DAB03|nr:vacuolar protein sorting-associated protein 9A-like [Zingiber officinale]